MATSTFDTLSVARELEAKGIEPDQAEAIVKAIRRSAGDHISAGQFDARFSEQRAYIDGRFSEQQTYIDGRFSEQRNRRQVLRTSTAGSPNSERTSTAGSPNSGRTSTRGLRGRARCSTAPCGFKAPPSSVYWPRYMRSWEEDSQRLSARRYLSTAYARRLFRGRRTHRNSVSLVPVRPAEEIGCAVHLPVLDLAGLGRLKKRAAEKHPPQ